MDSRSLLFDSAVLLTGALVLGLTFQRLRQGAIVGYLLAGTLAGPTALGLVHEGEAIEHLAELGVAMLMFTIGLEFSWRRLVGMGRLALGGVAQTAACAVVFAGLASLAGFGATAAFVVGAVVALSSTAVVLRLLKDRAEIDSLHGRTSTAVLLTQDVLIVPLVLVVTFLGGERGDLARTLVSALGGTLLFVLAGLVVAGIVIPRLLNRREVAQNRELPVLVAVATAITATYAASEVGLSPALGTFIAGVLLAESRFADQMRADVSPLRTVFVTLFFASIGLLIDMPWVMANLGLVLGMTAGMVLLKASVSALALRPFQPSTVACIASGFCVAQVGEFSFVLAGIARAGGIIDADLFQLIVASSVLSLLATPFLVQRAYPWGRWLALRVVRSRSMLRGEREARAGQPRRSGHAVLIGYGDAGQSAAGELANCQVRVLVVDVDPHLVALAARHGHETLLGDATQAGNLARADIASAAVAIIAIPDAHTTRLVTSQCKMIGPGVPVVARARYHAEAAEIDVTGADIVVDEEQLTGRRLGKRAGDLLGRSRAGADDHDAALPPVWS